MDQYQRFLEGSTHREVQTYLTSIGFSSAGANIYTSNLDDTVTHQQAMDYIMSEHGIFQLENVVMKPTGKANDCSVTWQFLLTITAGNLDSSSYSELVSGTYDSGTMDRFATNPTSQTTDLFDFISETSAGHEETESNACPYFVSAVPFWGWGPSSCTFVGYVFNPRTGLDDQPTWNSCDPSYYIFWIRVRRGNCRITDYDCNSQE